MTISGKDSVAKLIEFSDKKTGLAKLFGCMTLLAVEEPYVMNRIKNFRETP